MWSIFHSVAHIGKVVGSPNALLLWEPGCGSGWLIECWLLEPAQGALCKKSVANFLQIAEYYVRKMLQSSYIKSAYSQTRLARRLYLTMFFAPHCNNKCLPIVHGQHPSSANILHH